MKNKKLLGIGFWVVALVVLASGFNYWESHKSFFGAEKVEQVAETTDFASYSPNFAAQDPYLRDIQPIFNNRCAACHSCLNSPCQLNLSSYEGLTRGAHKLNVYGPIESRQPTRLDLDGKTEDDWRAKGFFSVINPVNGNGNIFEQLLTLKSMVPDMEPPMAVEAAVTCPSTGKDIDQYLKKRAWGGMPYGLPRLTSEEETTLTNWARNGFRGPDDRAMNDLRSIPPAMEKQVRDWENFLNGPEKRNKLVGRYIYEHLFLAHLYFPELELNSPKKTFFRLVRSKTECAKGLDIIATRRPNDNPGVAQPYYCFDKVTSVIVDKTHIPYELSPGKLNTLNKLFFERQDWFLFALPGYSAEENGNPFFTFAGIPADTRYKFLLMDSRYHVNTFIKGPVCFGNSAVDAIDEQFYVMFMDPKSDLMVNQPTFMKQGQNYLNLPALWGSDLKLEKAPQSFQALYDQREAYRKLKYAELKKAFPQGLGLENLWDGDGTNKNALLTVMRHSGTASVMWGARGDVSKTAFVLDYSLFERLVYDLTVGFDVFSGVPHQLLTRNYMSYIRLESEDNYLMFFPPELRQKLSDFWYRGLITNMRMKLLFKRLGEDIPTKVQYKDLKMAQSEFIEKFFFERLSQKVRGAMDPINWKKFRIPAGQGPGLDRIEEPLAKIASVHAKVKPFSNQFPDVTFLRVKRDDGKDQAFSIVHHNEHTNIGWIFMEEQRQDDSLDSLSIFHGFVGSYPNLFLVVNENDLPQFVDKLWRINSKGDFKSLVKKYGVHRMNPDFWNQYDWFNAKAAQLQPFDSGLFDLTKYFSDEK